VIHQKSLTQTIIKLRPVTPGIRHDALIITVVVNEQGLVGPHGP
jgi:hypothetical protein